MEFTQTEIEITILSLKMARELADGSEESRPAVETIDGIIKKLENMQGDNNDTDGISDK